MKSLHHKVNIVPVIAKADMLTQAELKKLKKKVNFPFILVIKITILTLNSIAIAVFLFVIFANITYDCIF